MFQEPCEVCARFFRVFRWLEARKETRKNFAARVLVQGSRITASTVALDFFITFECFYHDASVWTAVMYNPLHN
jgi:hypothetical protein